MRVGLLYYYIYEGTTIKSDRVDINLEIVSIYLFSSDSGQEKCSYESLMNPKATMILWKYRLMAALMAQYH